MKTIIILLFTCLCLQAQEHNIWYFGSNAGLDFNSGAPVAITDGQIDTQEGCATISDANGQLLFYTDGVTVYNKNHQVMQNGFGLMGHNSSIQSAIIVHKPGSTTQYYIFTTTAAGLPDGLRYSEVNMNADSGLGEVTEKNILLHTPTTEALTATMHSNGDDVWVITHNFGSNTFSAYLVTSGGVNISPVISNIGSVPNGNGHCTMKVSPSGNKIVFAIQELQDGLHLLDFNNTTGTVSGLVQLSGSDIYGLEFSSSGEVLYAGDSRALYQYDLLANNINASITEIFALPLTEFTSNLRFLQRAPDNKIYIARPGSNYLSVINNPDAIGINCDFQENGITLGELYVNYSTLGLPNNVLSQVFRINASSDTLCQGTESTFTIAANLSQLGNISWNFGDGTTSTAHNPVHTFQDVGSYTVTLTAQLQGTIRTAQTTVVVLPAPQIAQPIDMVLCDESGSGTASFNLNTQNASILGSQNPDNFLITYHAGLEDADLATNSLPENYSNITNPQTVYARMEDVNSGCYAVTSFELFVEPKPEIIMPDSFSFCRGSSVVLAGPEGFISYLWSTGETTRYITVNQPGNYTLTVVRNINGLLCENSKNIMVYVSDTPIITQVYITEWTDNHNAINISVSGNGDYEYSIDGFTYQDSPEFLGLESGMYTVFVRDKNGCGTATEEVVLLMYPKFFTPNGDGINDMWRIIYSWNEPALRVHIFDRYNKHIISFMGSSPGWDGRYNGNMLPATDYWFTVEREDGRHYKGHFSLIR